MNNKNIATCQKCGSGVFLKKEVVKQGQITLGPEFEYTEFVYTCKKCGAEGEGPGGDIKESYEKAHREAQLKLQSRLVNELKLMGYSLVRIERALELSSRTLDRIRHGRSFSTANLSLIRILRVAPWLIDVAEQNFDKKYMTARMASYLADEFKNFNK